MSNKVSNNMNDNRDDYILSIVREQYHKNVTELEVLRDFVGTVYRIKDPEHSYVLKVFKEKHKDEVKSTANLMRFLKEKGISVPEIYQTITGDNCIMMDDRCAVLYEYIDGEELNKENHLRELGEFAGKMRKAMEEYKQSICNHGEEFFIQRYLDILEQKKYCKIDEFAEIGHALWNKVSNLPTGFLHGDFHAGNFFLRKGTLLAYDFDAASIASPMYDVATMCDATDYFSLDEDNFTVGKQKTESNVALFLEGYQTYYSINDKEMKSIFDWIAIRHFDIQATIINTLGLDCVDDNFLSQQLSWLKRWAQN